MIRPVRQALGASWEALVDIRRLADWMDSEHLGSGPIRHARMLAGGTQNVLLRFERDGRDFVLRRPPLHPYMDGNETMRREATVLKALAGSDVPHPSLIAACPGVEVLGASFYLMEPVEGFNATLEMPPFHRENPARRKELGFAVVDAVAALGRIDHEAVGLPFRGVRGEYLRRQPGRWRSQLHQYGRFVGWPGATSLPGVDRVGEWLDRWCPGSMRPGVVHGDYHLANVMFDKSSSTVAAIVDWELTTIGDPLLDLGWLLATWPNPDGSGGTVSVNPWDGFPSAAEVIARYQRSSDRDLSAIGWFVVFACYKLGILLEGTHARACAGLADKVTGDTLHERAKTLFDRAEAIIRSSGHFE